MNLSMLLATSLVGTNPICTAGEPTSSVAIAAEDHAALESFYVDTLGFTMLRRLEFEGIDPILILKCGTLGLEIVPAGGPIPERPAGGGLNAGPFKFGIVVPDFDAAHERLVKAGIEMDYGPVTDDSGVRFLMFRDPKGNRIQLFDDFDPATADAVEAQAIAERARQFSATYVAGDIDALMDYYTEGGVGMPGGREPMVGREALHRYWAVPEGVEVIDHETVSEDLRIEGNVAIDRGNYRGSSRRNGEVREFTGRYLVVWTRGEDGLWRMSEDMWAAN